MVFWRKIWTWYHGISVQVSIKVSCVFYKIYSQKVNTTIPHSVHISIHLRHENVCFFTPINKGNPNRTMRQPASASSNIRMQIQSLLTLIKDRRSHYVFCIKPNKSKKANLFELPLVQHQVRYTNIMPLVNIWRTGYCFHLSHMNFLNRYKILHRETWPVYRVSGVIECIATILHELPLPSPEFIRGTTKIFMRSPRTVLPEQ